MRVAIVGGTGGFGRALAIRPRAAGVDVVIGSRDADRAAEIAAEHGVSGASNEDACRGVDLAVLATKAEAAVETARTLQFASPLLSVASQLRSDEPRSVAERVADVVSVPVVAGLHSLAAAKLGEAAPDEDVFVCGDDSDAKALALELAAKIVVGRAVDAGPLRSARALEGMTGVLIAINKRYKTHAGLRITGL